MCQGPAGAAERALTSQLAKLGMGCLNPAWRVVKCTAPAPATAFGSLEMSSFKLSLPKIFLCALYWELTKPWCGAAFPGNSFCYLFTWIKHHSQRGKEWEEKISKTPMLLIKIFLQSLTKDLHPSHLLWVQWLPRLSSQCVDFLPWV